MSQDEGRSSIVETIPRARAREKAGTHFTVVFYGLKAFLPQTGAILRNALRMLNSRII
jgi:hypothetical protein